jgi:hypothetical protein
MIKFLTDSFRAFAVKYLGATIFAAVGLMGLGPDWLLGVIAGAAYVDAFRAALLLLLLLGTYLVLRQAFPAQTEAPVPVSKPIADELWTFWRAHRYVSEIYGDGGLAPGKPFPADALMSRASRGDVRTEGVRAAQHKFMGLNDGPLEPIDPTFWRQNELPMEGYMSDEADGRRTQTKRRQIGHYDWAGGQYVDIHVHAGDLTKINWTP